MTLVMPETDLSTVLTEDLVPPCEWEDGAAVWVAKVTNTVCGCCFTFLICDSHKDAELQAMADPTPKPWKCSKCGTKWGPNAYADDMILDLEELR